MKKIILIILAAALLLINARGQELAQFSGDTAKFTTELKAFMGTLVSKPQIEETDRFISLYDSTFFAPEVKSTVINVASQLRGRRISQVPGRTRGRMR